MHLIFLCAEDGERMKLVQGKFGLFYRCPNHLYPSEAEKQHKESCSGRLTLQAANLIENMVEQLEGQGKLDDVSRSAMIIHLKKCDIRLIKRSKNLCEVIVKRKKGSDKYDR